MADVVTRLKLETTQYDSKLRDASKSLSDFAKNASKAGGDFQKLAQTNMEAARSFGDIATGATNSKDKLKELVAAYNEVARAYNNLTKEQQQSDFGKAMSDSLETLKGRISETKQELYGAGEAMSKAGDKGSGLGGVLDSITKKFGISTSSLATLSGALAATTGAIKVAKDAFFTSESNVDEWGRTVTAAQSIYTSFLNALNTSNFSGFFSRMDNLIQKAREAYDAMDRLNTVMTIINPERAKLQARQTQLQTIIRREGANSEAGKQAQIELKALEPKLQASYRTEAGLNYNAFQKQVEKRLAEYGIQLSKSNFDLLMTTFHDESAYNKLAAKARGSITKVDQAANPNTPYKYVDTRKTVDTRNVQQKIMDAFTDEWRQTYSPYLTAAFGAIGQSYGVLKQDARYIKPGGGGGSRGGGGGTTKTEPVYVPVAGSIDAYEAQLQNLNKQWKAAADDDSRAKIKTQIEGVTAELDRMNGKTKEPPPVGSMKYYSDWLKDLQEKQQLVTNNNDWEFYAGQIDFVTKKMKELRGETKKLPELATGLSGTSSGSIGAWIKELQEGLSSLEIGSEAYMQKAANILDATTFQNLITEAANRGISMASLGIDNEALWDAILGGENIPDKIWKSIEDAINTELANRGVDQIQIDTMTGSVSTKEGKGNKFDESMTKASKALSSISSIKGGLENMGVKLPASIDKAIGVMQGVIAIIQGVETVISIFSATTQTANTVATGANTVALGALTAAIWANTATSIIPGFANGGMVQHAANGRFVSGRRFSSDLTPVWANAGELILSRAQQGNIASQLTGGMGNLQIESYISGEDIRIVVSNANRRRGRGEYLMTKTR